MYYVIEADSCNKWPWIDFIQQTSRCLGVFFLKKWTHVTKTTSYNYTKLFKFIFVCFFSRCVNSPRVSEPPDLKNEMLFFIWISHRPTFSQVYLCKKWQFSSQRRDESYCSCSRCVKTPLCLCISVFDLAEEKTLDSRVYICKTNLLTLWEKTLCEHKSDIFKNYYYCFRRNIRVTRTTLAFIHSCVCVHLMNINVISAL